MRTLEQMKETAQRHLDGMTTNRDQMAKDVLWLADTVRRLENMVKESAASQGASRDQLYRDFWSKFGGRA
ncbi:hypothetical protein J2W88_003939 [Acidovorax delafieldii]|uniref:Uncharacterized protein n=1 Tax=Acidovorax delafieldii TaxID=47920 RepID=A0AAJ2BYU7_ACIDE|nr:hypothetical protein [Acidovorax delafieldii]MDR6768635.1 hypothetical protein [Acidovorax delafieldii]MDR6837350.1 hypothetical protein [Acidovorax delafieldii]MDR7366841.1 hypothetical protein [Acidovorax delafieldii]